MDKEYKKWLTIFLIASCILLAMVVIGSIQDVNRHNNAALYGEEVPYSKANVIIAIYEVMFE